MKTLGDLRARVLIRLGDPGSVIWPTTEVDVHLKDGYQQLASAGVFWDAVYPENLPATFSYSQTWERVYLPDQQGFNAGCANFTYEDERRTLGDGRDRIGPANHTSPFEVDYLANVGADTSIPATADLPASVIALDRVTWDGRGIDALDVRTATAQDARYEITTGEVYGYLWQKDGVRTLRKVRVPGAQAATITPDGDWGVLRDPTDLSQDTVVATVEQAVTTDGRFGIPRTNAASVTGTWGSPRGVAPGQTVTGSWGLPRAQPTSNAIWGLPRVIPGHHPIGTELFGLPRRPYLETTNVRVEHLRQGRALTTASDVCELPDRYALYLCDYALSRCLDRSGPGQDSALAAHFLQRWARGQARIARRLTHVDPQHVSVMGGDGSPSTTRPPHPSLPWAYGSPVR